MKKNKKLCAIIGNCQAEILPKYLLTNAEFSDEYEIINIPGIYQLTQEEFITGYGESLKDVELLIYQPLSERFGPLSSSNISNLVSSLCKRISFPSLFFTGYNPEVAYLRDKELRSLLYVDRFFWQLWKDKTPDLLVEKLNDLNFFPEWFSLMCVEESINECIRRETSKGVNIIMSDFIKNNYKSKRLFHVLNHPSATIMLELSSRILSELGFKPNTSPTPISLDEGIMGEFSFPIYASHHKNLQLQFPRGEHRFFGNISVSHYIDVFSKEFEAKYNEIEEDSLRFSFTIPKSRTDVSIIGEMESELLF